MSIASAPSQQYRDSTLNGRASSYAFASAYASASCATIQTSSVIKLPCQAQVTNVDFLEQTC